MVLQWLTQWLAFKEQVDCSDKLAAWKTHIHEMRTQQLHQMITSSNWLLLS